MSLFQVAEAFTIYEKKLRGISDLIQQIRLLVPKLPPSLDQVSEGKNTCLEYPNNMHFLRVFFYVANCEFKIGT
jgi:hypothetical protein